MTVDGEDTALKACKAAIAEAYEHFTGLQEQKMRMAEYVLSRQSEIDDPAEAARSVLLSRYPHVDIENFDDLLKGLSSLLVKAGQQKDEPPLKTFFAGLGEHLDEVLGASGQELPEGYLLAGIFAFTRPLLATARAGGNVNDLRASLFTSLIADFESFLVSLMTELYRQTPQKLGSKERSVAWSTLFAVSDLEALREELLEQAVVDVMRGSFDDWMAALARDHDVSIAKYASSPLATEMFQRRHILVHNGGRVSRLYRDKCPKVDVELGQKLNVTAEYFETAADCLAVIALALAVNAILKLDRSATSDTESLMTDWVYELLLRRRYQAVYDYLSDVPIERMKNLNSAEICRVNRWLALKRLGRFSECRTEVTAWQVNHLGDVYQLAKHVLLGEFQEAKRVSDALRAEGKLSLKHWVEWPLLEEVRAFETREASPGSDDPGPELLQSEPHDEEGSTDEH